jgi:hypothetical protein
MLLLTPKEHDEKLSTRITACCNVSDTVVLPLTCPQPAITPFSPTLGKEVSDVKQHKPTLVV